MLSQAIKPEKCTFPENVFLKYRGVYQKKKNILEHSNICTYKESN